MASRETDMTRRAAGQSKGGRPLRVALVVGRSKLAGTERHVLELAKALPPDRADVTVVVFSEGALTRRLREAGIKVRVFDRRTRFDPLLLITLSRFFASGSFDVVHAHPERIACLAAKLAGVPAVVMTYHLIGPQSAGIKKPGLLLYLAEKARAAVVDFTIAVSKSDAEFLVSGFGKRSDRVACILNGIGTAEPRPGNRDAVARGLGIRSAAGLVVTAARLSPQKGIQYLVTAMKKVVEKIPGAVLVVAGEGELESELKALAESSGVSANVVFAGYREDIFEIVSVCDVFVLPSLWEGMPYAILEAMLLARPVVTTAVSTEAVVDGETGFVVPSRDDAALARAITKLLADPQAAARMGLAGRQRLKACFSSDRMAAQTLEVYERALSLRAGGRGKERARTGAARRGAA